MPQVASKYQNKGNTSMKRRKKPIKSKNRRTKPIDRTPVPEWFKSLPYRASDHGSNAHQKRLWRFVSEYVRQRDAKLYGRCVSCSTPLSWMAGQAGHFRAWTRCNGMFKYNDKNLALICAGCNMYSDGVIDARFADEMRRRHGQDYVEWIDAMNKSFQGSKLELADLIKYAEEIRNKKAQI